MVVRVIIKKDTFRDSITLMKISNQVSGIKGVSNAGVVMATPLNKKLLKDVGFSEKEIEKTDQNDLVVAIEADDQSTLDKAVKEAEELLSSKESSEKTRSNPRTLDSALEQMKDANLVTISVPGRFAKREAMKALEKGLNVFLFSSNVSLDDELELKRMAMDKNLLMMGPDCGTAIINGVVLGFGNKVRQGYVGLVSASGTGLQEVSTLLNAEGLGVSQAIGTGGNDLSEKVGGMMMIEGIRRLEQDKKTRVIIIISKPPNPKTTQRVLEMATQCKKPVIVNFLGERVDLKKAPNCTSATTLEEAVRIASKLIGKKSATPIAAPNEEEMLQTARSESERFSSIQKYVRGLFSGGTLCYESQYILKPLVGEVYSNAPVNQKYKIQGDGPSKEHTCIDMGSSEFVEGRLHPIIDFTLRKRRIIEEAKNPQTAVILLDVVLGYAAHPNPAGELVPLIIQAKNSAVEAGRFLSLVASVVGTDKDPQDLQKQLVELRKAGVVIMPSNAQAAKVAALIALRGSTRRV